MKPQNYHPFDIEAYYTLKCEGIDFIDAIRKSSGIPKEYFDNTDKLENEETDNRLLLML